MSLSAYNSLVMVSQAEDQESILGLLKTIHATDPSTEFSLLNVYKELPITSVGRLVEVKTKTVEFLTNQTQFSIINEAREVVIRSKSMNTSIIGKAIELDCRRLQVTLGDFSYVELHTDKRSSVRVRLKLPMNLQMAVDGNYLSGVIDDISLGGVCVRTFNGDMIGRAEKIELKIKLLHSGTNEVMEALVPSSVVRIDKRGMQARCAMVFAHTTQSERVLSTFIYQRQLEIIKELKSKL